MHFILSSFAYCSVNNTILLDVIFTDSPTIHYNRRHLPPTQHPYDLWRCVHILRDRHSVRRKCNTSWRHKGMLYGYIHQSSPSRHHTVGMAAAAEYYTFGSDLVVPVPQSPNVDVYVPAPQAPSSDHTSSRQAHPVRRWRRLSPCTALPHRMSCTRHKSTGRQSQWPSEALLGTRMGKSE